MNCHLQLKSIQKHLKNPMSPLPSYYNDNVNLREFSVNIEETEPPVIYNSASDGCAEPTTNQGAISMQNTPATIDESNSAQTTLPIVDQNEDSHSEMVCISDDSDDEMECTMISMQDNPATINRINSEQTTLPVVDQNRDSDLEIVCISDDSDVEIECTVISKHKIVEPPKAIEARITQQPTLGPIFVLPHENVAEEDMIRSLFKKYFNSSEKCENSCQTFSPTANSIKYTNTNLIILENMLSELLAYRIPVQLESKPKIQARFKDEVAALPALTTLECWEHKTPIDIRRPASNNSAISLNVLNTNVVRRM